MSSGKNTVGHRVVRSWSWLDGAASVFGTIVATLYRIPGSGVVKALLHGTWPLGHPLHPAITDLTIGGYTAAVALDVMYLVTHQPGLPEAASFLLGAAFLTSLVSIASGLTDWNETYGSERRTGILHGLLMLVATLGFVISLVLRLSMGSDLRTAAIAVSAAAWLVTLVAGFLGGEMVFGFGTQVNRQAWAEIGDDWETLDVRAAALEDRVPVLAKTKEGVDLFVSRVDGAIFVIGDRCTHAGGPLHEGTWVGAGRCEIECPWHASRFCVKDGGARTGPATFSEPTWETRVSALGALEVRARA